MGSPYVKAVCMGRALMIPGMVGKNIAQWIKDGNLPKTVSKYGTKIEEIFVSYEEVKKNYGTETDSMPLGAIAMFTFAQKFKVGLQQLMAGSRNFAIKTISRKNIMSLTREAEEISQIPHVMNAYRTEAMRVLNEK